MRLPLLTILHVEFSYTQATSHKIGTWVETKSKKKCTLSCKNMYTRKMKYRICVTTIQNKLYLCERRIEKLTTSPLPSNLFNYFQILTSHKNLIYSGVIWQFKRLNCVMVGGMCTRVLRCVEISGY
jgi:hypothetical protein